MNPPKMFMGVPQQQRMAPMMRTRNPFHYMSGSIAAAQKKRKARVPRPPGPKPY